ncbi:MAG: EAL domain-containing protein, partial [Nocardioides sp.]|uniref:EAL domain-containing protein n=1 Tax=Nocardioides sp. TaxID=35761 RepID=UPI0039E5BDDD
YQASHAGVAVGEGVAACGTAAARGEPVMVADLGSDALWAPYRESVELPVGVTSCWSYPVKGRDGRVVGTFAFYMRDTDVPVEQLLRIVDASVHLCFLAIEREAVRREIDQVSNTDSLTGLLNRRGWHNVVAMSPALGRLSPSAAIVLEVDRLSDINRSEGLHAGDRAIVAVGRALQAQLLPGEALARVESNRFAIFVPGADEAIAELRSVEVRQRVNVTVGVDGHEVGVTATGGISLFPEHGRTAPDLLEHALLAAQDARSRGVATAVFDASASAGVRERLVLGGALRDAIERGSLMQWYQPQYKEDGTIHGFEALARWHHPVLGIVSPMRFIPLAEELGLLQELDFWAISRACRQVAAWTAEGVACGSISVNVSPDSLVRPGLVRHVADQLLATGVSPADLTLEMTERATSALPETGVVALRGLRSIGVGLSIDDFGTGYANLSNLATLPVTEVKIDRSFTAGVRTDRRSRALIRAIIGLAQDLALDVVAEGVENEDERQALLDLGCTVFQGYLYAPAMPADQAAAGPVPTAAGTP